MEIKGSGKQYLNSIRKTAFLMGNSKARESQKKVVINKSKQDLLTIGSDLKGEINSVDNLKSMLEDLKNTNIIKDKNSLSLYTIDNKNNDANVNVEILDYKKLSKNSFTLSIKKLPQSGIISSDNINSDRALNLRGHIEVNGANIVVKETDTLSTIKNKLNYGEDINQNGELDSGEDINSDDELMGKDDMRTKNYTFGGKLYLETKSSGNESSIDFNGSTQDVMSALGFISENGDIKNLIQSGENGEILINNDSFVLKDSSLEYKGLKFDFANSIEGKTSKIEVNYNKERVLSNIEEFTNKYNKIIDYINNYAKKYDSKIQDIKYKLGTIENKNIGVNLKAEKYYKELLKVKSGLGEVFGNALENSGFVKDKSGELKIDTEKLNNDFSDLREYLINTGTKVVNKKLNEYLNDVNILDIKKEASIKNLLNSNKKSKKMSILKDFILENQKNLKFLKNNLKDIKNAMKSLRNNFKGLWDRE
ncbi:flagellar filament capping protein FliD [Haliovirga abyssi]|uniref:Flagellar hook-associated protein 2 C-terminal domain-containing protein n=1 Tax=Haliovirga abyssi TaxID=2996794 RepID=A0AAU9DP64_9FUSO|nr:flagellar filament capping protein FliD [Haliovirga abyssi]BDU50188.1 hypothetical protein HLVA_07570 [Haliovirga abyssi]